MCTALATSLPDCILKAERNDRLDRTMEGNTNHYNEAEIGSSNSRITLSWNLKKPNKVGMNGKVRTGQTSSSTPIAQSPSRSWSTLNTYRMVTWVESPSQNTALIWHWTNHEPYILQPKAGPRAHEFVETEIRKLLAWKLPTWAWRGVALP